MLLKLLPLIAPFIIFIIIRLIRSYITSILFTKKQSKSNEMIACNKCGTYVDEDLVLKRFGKFYCSKDCLNQ